MSFGKEEFGMKLLGKSELPEMKMISDINDLVESKEKELGDFNPGFMESLGFSNELIESKVVENDDKDTKSSSDIIGLEQIKMNKFDMDFLKNLGFTDDFGTSQPP